MQLLPNPVHHDGDLDLRDLHHFCDLGIFITLEETQGKDLGRSRVETRESDTEGVASLAIVPAGRMRRRFLERDGGRGLTRADDIQSAVNGGTAEVALRVIDRQAGGISAEQPKENGLHHIFGIGGIAGDAVGRPEDEAMAFLEDPLNIGWG